MKSLYIWSHFQAFCKRATSFVITFKSQSLNCRFIAKKKTDALSQPMAKSRVPHTKQIMDLRSLPGVRKDGVEKSS